VALAKSQRSLKSWSKQKWRTKSGKPSSTTRAKRKGTKQGKQFVKQPKSIAKKTRAYRKVK